MQTKHVALTMFLLGGVFLATSAQAESLEEKEKWDRQSHFMIDPIEDANRMCGLDKKNGFTHAWDKASFAGQDPEAHSWNGFCGAVFDRMNVMCRDTPSSKPIITTNIKKVVCRYGGKGKFGLSLANGTLTYTMDWDESHADDKIEAFLKKSLPSSVGGSSATTATTGSTPAGGGAGAKVESLAEKEKWDRQTHFMSDKVKLANSRCEVPQSAAIGVEWDRASFAGEDAEKRSFDGFCGEVFERLNVMCQNNVAAKKPVQKKIKKVKCRYGGKGKFGLDLAKDGTLTYTIDWDVNAPHEKIDAFLKKKL